MEINKKHLQFIQYLCEKYNKYNELNNISDFISKYKDEYDKWFISDDEKEKLKMVLINKNITAISPAEIIRIFNKTGDIESLKKIIYNNGLISFSRIPKNIKANIYDFVPLSRECINLFINKDGHNHLSIGKGEILLSLVIKDVCKGEKGRGDLYIGNNEYVEVKSDGGVISIGGKSVTIVSKYLDKYIFKRKDKTYKDYFANGKSLKYLLEKLNKKKVEITSFLEVVIDAVIEQYELSMEEKDKIKFMCDVLDSLKDLNFSITPGNWYYERKTTYPLIEFLGYIQMYCYVKRLRDLDYLFLFDKKSNDYVLLNQQHLLDPSKLKNFIKFYGCGGNPVSGPSVVQNYSVSLGLA